MPSRNQQKVSSPTGTAPSHSDRALTQATRQVNLANAVLGVCMPDSGATCRVALRTGRPELRDLQRGSAWSPEAGRDGRGGVTGRPSTDCGGGGTALCLCRPHPTPHASWGDGIASADCEQMRVAATRAHRPLLAVAGRLSQPLPGTGLHAVDSGVALPLGDPETTSLHCEVYGWRENEI